MSAQKRNEWQEAEEEEVDSDQGYDSYAADLQKDSRVSAHKAKRRKVVENVDESNGDDSDHDQGEAHRTVPVAGDKRESLMSAVGHNDGIITSPASFKVLTPATLRSSIAASKKTGVVYLSRIPPFMRPQKVKQLLSRFGTVGRVFLQPEDPASYARRKRFGGNKKRSFEDGWVEFVDKKAAKLVVETLNATTIGGKKGNYYHDDVWNMKYLKGFKWHHLTEQIANENAEKAARLRADISRTNRENKLFVRNVERAKMLETMDAKRKNKEIRESEKMGKADDGSGGTRADEPQPRSGFKRYFKQNEVRKSGGGAGAEQSEEVKRVLSKIF